MEASQPRSAPGWLRNLERSTPISNRRIRKLLDESFFYAAAGRDSRTLLQHADEYCCFVYVDILPDERGKFFDAGIPNYRQVFRRSVPGDKLIKGGWPAYVEYFPVLYEIPSPFTAELGVYDLLEAPHDEEGESRTLFERIAVLFIHGECINTFAALYVVQGIAPRAIYFLAQMDGDLNVAMLCPGRPFESLLERLPEHKPGMLQFLQQERDRYGWACPQCG